MRHQFTGLWRHPDFLKLWTGQTVSIFGSLITWTALQFTAIQVLDASPFQVAVLGAADIVAGILVGLAAGVWVDRLRRRSLMIATDMLRAVLVISVPLAALLGVLSIGHLYAVAFLAGVLTIVFDVSYQSYLPSLIRREDLVEGNSKMTASASAAEIGAFSVTGWLVQLLTAPFAMVIDAVTYLVSAASLLWIRAPEPPPAVEQREGMRTEILEGLRAILGDRVLRALTASAGSEALGRGVIGSVIVLYLNRELGFSPGVLGMIFAVGGVSSLAGAVLADRITRRFGVGRAMALSLAVASAGTLCIPLAGDVSLVAAALLIASQLITDPASTVNDITAKSMRQAVTPDRLLGRVNGSLRFAVMLFTLVGMVTAGLLAEAIGLRATLFAGATLGFLAALWLVLSPVWSVRAVVGASSIHAEECVA
ncbi:MAG: MFS transporter [Dehalococcoidia bacterium]